MTLRSGTDLGRGWNRVTQPEEHDAEKSLEELEHGERIVQE